MLSIFRFVEISIGSRCAWKLVKQSSCWTLRTCTRVCMMRSTRWADHVLVTCLLVVTRYKWCLLPVLWVCVCVCVFVSVTHASNVLKQLHTLRWFLSYGFPSTYCLLYFKEIGHLKIRVLPSRTLSRTLDLENLAMAHHVLYLRLVQQTRD